MEREEKIKALEEALDLKAPLEILKKYSKYNQFVKISVPYSIERIRKAFTAYANGEITKEYFFLWCRVCAKVIEQGCIEEYDTHEGCAKKEIAWRLRDVAQGHQDLSLCLSEIEDIHRIVTGERESDLYLASDEEIICLCVSCDEDLDEDVYDIIVLNHYRKTYAVHRGVDAWGYTDNEDLFGMGPNVSYASKMIFDIIYQNLHTLGYKKLQDGEE